MFETGDETPPTRRYAAPTEDQEATVSDRGRDDLVSLFLQKIDDARPNSTDLLANLLKALLRIFTLLKSLDPIVALQLIRLKFDHLCLQFLIALFKLDNVFADYGISLLELRLKVRCFFLHGTLLSSAQIVLLLAVVIRQGLADRVRMLGLDKVGKRSEVFFPEHILVRDFPEKDPAYVPLSIVKDDVPVLIRNLICRREDVLN